MFWNDLKIALRNFWKNKTFSAINIFGLATGIATCLLIVLFAQKQISYERYNEKADRMVRVTFHGKMNGGIPRGCELVDVCVGEFDCGSDCVDYGELPSGEGSGK